MRVVVLQDYDAMFGPTSALPVCRPHPGTRSTPCCFCCSGGVISPLRRGLTVGNRLKMTLSSPKLLSLTTGPRLIVYHQTLHDPEGNYHSLLPLLTNNTGITHVIIAAIHLNDEPGNITLNDHHPDDKRHDQLWGEVKWLQGSGVKVLGMLGGAAKGSFEKLGGDDENVRPSCTMYPSLRSNRLTSNPV